MAADISAKLKRASARITEDIAERDRLIRQAAEMGMTRRQIAEHVALSHQRVHQIVSDGHQQTP